jgi:hypothetical protein
METDTKTAPVDERKALRIEYEKATGKKPFAGWNADELRSHIAVSRAASAMQGEGPGPVLGEDRVTVIMMADGVHLPLETWDAETQRGVVAEIWGDVPGPVDSVEGLSDTEKMALVKRLDPRPVPRKSRLDMPRSCAEFLSKRDQAEII